MEQRTYRLYLSGPLENKDLAQQLEQKLNDVNSFSDSNNNSKKMVTYFKDENHKAKKKYKNFKPINTILESKDKIVINGAASTSIILSITGIGLNILPVSAGIACASSPGNKVLHRMIINKYKKYKKHYEKDQQIIESFDKLYRKSFQDNIIVENENQSIKKFFPNIWMKQK